MLVAALDTSTLQGTVGWISVSDDSPDSPIEVTSFAECSAPVKPGHAETLIDRLENVLRFGGFKLGDVNLIVFGRGPGTFTGLRIGLSTVKGIAVANDCPVVGISSLEGIALSCGVEGQVACVIDARRGELFGALYKTQISNGLPTTVAMADEWVAPIDSIVSTIKEKSEDGSIFLTGNGVPVLEEKFADQFGDRLKTLPRRNWSIAPYWLARVGLERYRTNGSDDLDAVVPNYLREPDAKLPTK